jgi:hypothetical protein
MPRLLSLLLCRFCLASLALLGFMAEAQAQGAPPTQWDRTLGGTESDYIKTVVQTSDGGYFLAGYSNSPVSTFKTQPRRGVDDYWVVKVDVQGVRQWDRTFGGTSTSLNYLADAQQTADGGYILGGYSNSDPGADRTAPSRGNYDYWLIKLDAQGTKQWDRAYGGAGPDYFTSLHQTADGGYILGGYSSSGVGGDKTQPRLGTSDYWVVKVDGLGVQQWDRTFGSYSVGPFNNGASQLQRVRQTADGGYVLGGFVGSSAGGDLTQPIRGDTDFWLIKLTAQGNKQWDRTLGGPGTDLLFGLRPTPDGGYVVAGTSDSGVGGEKSAPSRGTGDYWVVKTDAQGIPQWDRTFGGTAYDNLSDVCLGTDGGYLLSGTSASGASADKTEAGRGGGDAWLVKVDDQGTKQWDRTIGGTAADNVNRAQPTTDGGYILACVSSSGISPDKTEPNLGVNQAPDFWLVKLAPPQVRITGPAVLCPGTTGQLVAVGTAPILTYRWSTGAATSTLPITQPGSYSVTATFAGGFTSTATLVVAPFTAVAVISGDTLLCPGRNLVLTAQAAGATALLWNTGATTPTLTVTQPGTYSLTATYAAGCRSQAQVRVGAQPTVPAFSLGRDTTLCEGSTLLLQAPTGAGPGVAYRWSTGATTPTLQVQQAGTYSLQILTACDVRMASRTIQFRPCLTIPTIVTANGDQRNDRFAIQGLSGDWSLQLYSRWGQRVYTTNAYRNEWGENAAAGIYYYLLTRPEGAAIHKGWVEVVR